MASTETTPKYMIGVAAQLVGMHPQTLRLYETRGLIMPRRTAGGTRLYSDADLARLRRVTDLASGLGLSLQGAEYVLRLEDHIAALERRTRDLEAALERAGDDHKRAGRRGAPLLPARPRRVARSRLRGRRPPPPWRHAPPLHLNPSTLRPIAR